MKWTYSKITEGDGVANRKENCNFSVIIRNKNEEKWIGHCVQSIIDNLYKPEIIIVDNNSSDESLDIVKTFIQDPQINMAPNRNYTDIKILNIEDYSPGKAINLGVRKAKKDYILIISAHCVLKNFNQKKIKDDLKKFIAIFGNQTPFWNGKRISKRYIWSHFGSKEKINMYSKLEQRYFFHNAISLFQKKTLIKYPFYEKLLGKEDRYWANNIVTKKKLKFLYDPSIEVDHHYTEGGNTWKGIG